MTTITQLADALPSVLTTEPLQWLTVGANLDPRFGGVSAIMPPLIRSVCEAGRVEMSLAAFCGPDEDVSSITTGVRKHQRHALKGLSALVPFQANPLLTEQIRAASGIHIHGIWQEHSALSARQARALRKPYIISAHGMLDPWALKSKRWKKDLYMNLIEKRNLQSAACLHALTYSEAESYKTLAPGVPVAVIPNGADVPASADPESFLARFPHLRGKHIVLFLARIHAKKGIDILLDAWRTVSAHQPDAHLVLAGPDSENHRASFEALTQSFGIEDRVTFTGMLAGPQKWNALAAAQLFILPSYSEGLSVSVLEAMGMALPVIVTEQCHVDGIVESQCGWQIQPRTSEIEAALDGYFALSTADTRRMGMRASDLVSRSYQWSGIGQRMSALYEWVSGGPRPAGVDLI